MKIKPAPFLLGFFVSLIIAFLSSCEELDIDSMKLTNNTNQRASYLAMTVEQSRLVDLKMKGLINNETRIISSGETVTLYEEDIWGYSPGDDLRFMFYEVIGDSAYMSGSLDITHKQLRKLRFHVVIDDEELTKRYE